jgi:hypothetical protein
MTIDQYAQAGILFLMGGSALLTFVLGTISMLGLNKKKSSDVNSGAKFG